MLLLKLRKIPRRAFTHVFLHATALAALFCFLLTPSFQVLLQLLAVYTIVFYIGHQLILHRYFSHGQFKVNKTIHNFFLFFSVLPCLGSSFSYRFNHRLHHKFSDTKQDIHGPEVGLFTTIYGFKTEDGFKLTDNDRKDALAVFIHNNYYLLFWSYLIISLVTSPVLFLILCFCVSFNIVMSDLFNFFNHFGHIGAYRNFATKDKSVNTIYGGYFAMCWHNNHHKFPLKANEQYRWWEIDLIYQLIIRWIKK
ncbi:hypothetical protein EBR43_07355 [bacterium]|nr:hypothetical protein [bacterium]